MGVFQDVSPAEKQLALFRVFQIPCRYSEIFPFEVDLIHEPKHFIKGILATLPKATPPRRKALLRVY